MKRAEFIEHWLSALESGQWKQAKKVLRRETSSGHYSYCCLGVACSLSHMIANKPDYFDGDKDWNQLLPPSLSRFMGIQTDGSFKEAIQYRGKTYHTLTDLNDEGIRFKTIARIIREQLAAKNFEKP